MIGKSIFHYEILARLGAGGMGVVYKARDSKLDRFVALKFLPPEFSSAEDLKARFLNEAKAASALDHANICTIHEIGETADGELFIVMAYYEGELLEDKIDRGPLPIREALDLGIQVASGLELAHEQGILHRDIKPANILVTRRGEAKILDFGLAKIVGAGKLTRTGTSMGTLSYMSPEQLRGEAVDGRSDVWALGAVVYEMATGRRAFGGDNEGAVVYAILNREPEPATAANDRRHRGLEPIVRTALAKAPGDRYRSMRELRVDLEALRRRMPTGQQEPTAPRPDDLPTLAHSSVAPAPDRASPVRAADRAGNTIAVVDFRNISQDPEAEWLTSGIAETLSVDLGRIASLRVVGRQLVRAAMADLRVTDPDPVELRRLAARLGARWVFWGGYQKLGESIRITAQCLDTRGGMALETIKIDGSMSEIFALQDEIIRRLVEALELEMSPSERRNVERPETRDLEAYEYCARARRLIHEMGRRGLEEARGYLQKAIDLDPDYALAYASLGQLQCIRFIATTDRGDLEQAIAHLERARRIDPDLADAYLWSAYAYSRIDRFEEALESARRSVQLDPDNPMSSYFLGTTLWLLGIMRHDTGGWAEAVEHLRRVNHLAPRYEAGHQILGALYLACGQYGQARACLEMAAEIEESGNFDVGKFVGGIALLGLVALRQGRLDEARELAERALRVSSGDDHVYTAATTAQAHWLLGETLFRQRRWDESLRSYRLARQQVEAHPRSLGIGWMLIHAHLGSARAFHRLTMLREEKQELRRAAELFEGRQDLDFSGIWCGGNGEIWLERAVCQAVVRRSEEALDALERAVECGWRETPRLLSEPAFEPLRASRRFRDLELELQAREALP